MDAFGKALKDIVSALNDAAFEGDKAILQVIVKIVEVQHHLVSRVTDLESVVLQISKNLKEIAHLTKVHTVAQSELNDSTDARLIQIQTQLNELLWINDKRVQ